jgi:hypothetical protein
MAALGLAATPAVFSLALGTLRVLKNVMCLCDCVAASRCIMCRRGTAWFVLCLRGAAPQAHLVLTFCDVVARTLVSLAIARAPLGAAKVD